MKRRELVLGAGAAWLLLPVGRLGAALAGPRGGGESLDAIRQNWRELMPARAEVPDPAQRVELSAEQWRQRLTEAQYRVLREEDTEPAGSSPLNEEHRPGVFVCAGCSLPLFTSEMKFESGTGWPSFFTHIPGHLGTKTDRRLFFFTRTEYHCIRCGGHQGHVFDDGPAPTGERWCNNGVALKFLPRD